MGSLYFLGGFPQGSSREEIKTYIERCLEVKDLDYVWLDPRHQRRAVFLCSQKIDIKKIEGLLETKPLNSKTLFGAEEKETELLYVEVPSMKCRALIDKLPWLFHQRKNGGSSVKDIEEIQDNNFKLTFQDGWRAVMNVTKSTWFISDTEVKVTPFFVCFQEDYKKQKERCKKVKRTEVESKDENSRQIVKQKKNPEIPPKSFDKNASEIAEQVKLVVNPGTPPKSFDKNASEIAEQVKLVVNPGMPPKSLEESDNHIAEQKTYTSTIVMPPKRSVENASSIVEQKKFVSNSGIPPKSSLENVSQIEQNKQVKISAEPKHKKIDVYLKNAHCVLLDSLALTEITLEKYPNVSIDVEKDKISLKGPDSLLTKLRSMIMEQYEIIESKWKDEYFFFLGNEHREHLRQYFHKHKITLQLEECENQRLELFVKQDQKRMSLPELLFSEVSTVQKFPLTSSIPEKKTEFQEYIFKFNTKHFEYKLDIDLENAWLFRFGSHYDEKNMESIVGEIQSFMKNETEPKPKALKTVNGKSAESQINKPAIKPKPKVENVGLDPDLVVLVNCLSLGTRMEDLCPVTLEINEGNGMIRLKGPPADVTKIKEMLFSLQQNFTSLFQNDFHMEFDKFLACESNRNLFMTHFKLTVEPEKEEFIVYIQDSRNTKKRFQEFVKRVLDQVEIFFFPDAASFKPDDQDKFLKRFNSREQYFKLIKIDSFWLLINLWYDNPNEQQVIQEIQNFVSNIKSVEVDKTGSKENADDEDDEKDEFHDASENVEHDDSKKQPNFKHRDSRNQPNEQKHTNDDQSYENTTVKNEQLIDLMPEQEIFLNSHHIFKSMVRDLKAKDLNITIAGSKLKFVYKDHKDLVKLCNAIPSYLSTLQSHRITLSYPSVKEFYESNEGRKLFSGVEKENACVVSCSDNRFGSHSKSGALSSGSKEEKGYKVAVLETRQTATNVFFHNTQGFGKNIHVQGTVHICPPRPENISDGNIVGKEMRVVLPHWSFKDRNDQGEKKFRERIDTVFSEVMNQGWTCISISVGSNCIRGVPCDILSSAIIEEANRTFRWSQNYIDIFLCEVQSAPLLRAFQYALKTTTAFLPPNDLFWETKSDLVTYKKQCPEYPSEMKFAVSPSLDTVNTGKQVLVCFPILTPLESSSCPLKEEISRGWAYDAAMKSLEWTKPDGLLVGEVHVFQSSPLRYCDVALYGLQPWGIDVKKALEQTLENCMEAGKKSRVDSLYIIVPGTAYPCLYPKEWLVSMWFHYLDNLMNKNAKIMFAGTVHFIVKHPEYRVLFEEHLKRRVKTKGIFNFKNIKETASSIGSLFSHTQHSRTDENSKSGSSQTAVEFTVISRANSASKVEKELKDALDKIMKKNREQTSFTSAKHNEFLIICERNNKIDYSPGKNNPVGKRGKKKYKGTISSLTQESIKDALNMLNGKSKSKSSSVDPVHNEPLTSSGEHSDEKQRPFEQLKKPNLRTMHSEGSNKNENYSASQADGDYFRAEQNMPLEGYRNDSTSQVTANLNERVDNAKQVQEPEKRQETPMDTDEPEEESEDQSEEGVENNAMNSNNQAQKQEEKLVKTESNVGGELSHVGTHTNMLVYTDSAAAESSLPPIENFEWYYHDTNNGSIMFDEDECDHLEKSYRRDRHYRVGGMNINFCTMVATSEDDHLKQFAVSRHELITCRRVQKPSNWTGEKWAIVKKREEEYKKIDEELEDFTIFKIERIQEETLWGHFNKKKKEMAADTQDKVMWQRINNGCKFLIAKFGCQKAFLTLKCDELGDGICFVSDANSCVSDSDRKKENKFTLVRCLVCLGAEGKGQPGLKFPPAKFPSVSNEHFSMVFSNIQVYPTHFIQVQALNYEDCSDS